MSIPTVTPIVTQSWIHAHAARLERMAIVAMVLLAGSWGISKFLDSRAAKAEARATTAEATLNAQQAANTQFASQTASVLSQYQAMVQALAAQNSSLAVSVAQRQASVAVQQHTDASLPVVDLTNRLKTLGNAPDGSVAASGAQITLSQPGAIAITQTLETLPALNANLADAKALLGSAQAAQAQAQLVIDSQTTQITGLKLTITDEAAACKAQVAAVKAAGRKSKWKFFKLGFILGFASGAYVSHVL